MAILTLRNNPQISLTVYVIKYDDYIYYLMGDWLSQTNTSNRFKQTYVQGFVDISGGKLILRNSDASFNANLSVGGNILYAGVNQQKLTTINATSYTVGYPLYQSYNITTNADTSITMPSIVSGALDGATFNFFKSNNANILVSFYTSDGANLWRMVQRIKQIHFNSLLLKRVRLLWSVIPLGLKSDPA